MSKVFRLAGFVACLIAVLAMSGGHWFALQTVAWGRMIADFSQQDSLGMAVAKTFSGKHPCSMCLQIRKGWHEEEQQQEKEPWLKAEKIPEVVWQLRYVTAPPAPTAPRHEQPTVPTLHTGFIETPPTPPPRFRCSAAL
jgi:hypothetical protein